eukprot:Nk52_evm3s224 gene=Nk52_evmTU3s224
MATCRKLLLAEAGLPVLSRNCYLGMRKMCVGGVRRTISSCRGVRGICTNSSQGQRVEEMVGVRSTKGNREYNEDRYQIRHLLPNLSYFGVFDGHGGSTAADYACAHLHVCVKRYLDANHKYSDALIKGFEKCDADFEKYSRRVSHIRSEPQSYSGTTAIVCLLLNDKLYTANCGDSRALLCKMGETIELSEDHCPDRDDEFERIIAAGGEVTMAGIPRVMGKLAMSRAIGDIPLKDVGVIATPEVKEIDIGKEDEFIVLATDGLFEVMTSDAVVDVVSQCKMPSEAAAELVSIALGYGSMDNITVVVVRLPGWRKFCDVRRPASFIIRRFGQSDRG